MYLVGYGEGRVKERRAERWGKREERLRLQAGRKICLPQLTGEGVAWLVS